MVFIGEPDYQIGITTRLTEFEIGSRTTHSGLSGHFEKKKKGYLKKTTKKVVRLLNFPFF